MSTNRYEYSKGAVFQTLRREYRNLQSELSNGIGYQNELLAQLETSKDIIDRARKTIEEFDRFAATMGWAPDWSDE